MARQVSLFITCFSPSSGARSYPMKRIIPATTSHPSLDGLQLIPSSLESDIKHVALHEAAHVVVANFFNLNGSAILRRVAKRSTNANRAYVGRARYDRTTNFRAAVIGWAGPLSGHFDDIKNVGDLEGWWMDNYWYIKDGDVCYSPTDRDAILGHPQVWRTCKVSHGILDRHREEWELEARCLIKRWAPKWLRRCASANRPLRESLV